MGYANQTYKQIENQKIENGKEKLLVVRGITQRRKPRRNLSPQQILYLIIYITLRAHSFDRTRKRNVYDSLSDARRTLRIDGIYE